MSCGFVAKLDAPQLGTRGVRVAQMPLMATQDVAHNMWRACSMRSYRLGQRAMQLWH